MSYEWTVVILFIALFLQGLAFGYWLGLSSRKREVREWQAIARRAQMLNRIADHLAQERVNNGNRQHEN